MNHLDTKTKSLLMVGMTFLAAITLAGTFVNVYLIRLTGNLGLIILQSIMSFSSLLIAFLLGTKLLHKLSINRILGIGVVSTITYYALILILKEKASDILMFLGVFNGIGSGLYYFSFNLLVGKVVAEENRHRFFGYQSSFGYVFGVVAPAVSGFIIVSFTALTGYYILFGMALILFVLAIIILTKITDTEMETDYHILKALRAKNKYWRTNLYINTSFGMREIIYTQIFAVFAYKLITNEQTVGNLISMMSFISVLSGVFIASKFTNRTQEKFYLRAAVLYFLAFMSLSLFPSSITLTFTYIVLGITISWYSVIYQTLKYKLSNYPSDGISSSDYIIASEFPMAAGRITGLIISLGLNYFLGDGVYSVLFVIISVMLLIDYAVIKKSVNWLKEE
jgi:YQGE family putative transporter